MAYRRTPFQVGEWFHCYNRGIDKRKVFESEDDAERFLQLLYLTNSSGDLRRGNITSHKTEDIVNRSREHVLSSVGAYCLMPNHFHLLLRELEEGGIVRFMQKLGTAYTMYFNLKYDRVGNLFLKPFRSRHIGDDAYFQRVVDYIHCNPIELFERDWKRGIVRNTGRLEQRLRQYRYSSFPDYSGERRPLRTILGSDGFDIYRNVRPRRMLEDARAYYADITVDDPALHAV